MCRWQKVRASCLAADGTCNWSAANLSAHRTETTMSFSTLLNRLATHTSRTPSLCPTHLRAVCRPQVEVLEGRDVPSFTPAVNYPAGLNPQAVATGDFNGDGRLDLVAGNYGSLTVNMLLGNGDSTFRTAS